MARVGLAELAEASFEKDGRQVAYRTVKVTPAAQQWKQGAMGELMVREAIVARGKRKRKTKVKVKAKVKTALRTAVNQPEPDVAVNVEVEVALRQWRREEARRRGVPAFRIFSDKTLHAIAEERPATAAELLAIPGIGIAAVEKYGRQIYRILRENEPR